MTYLDWIAQVYPTPPEQAEARRRELEIEMIDLDAEIRAVPVGREPERALALLRRRGELQAAYQAVRATTDVS